MYEDKAKEAINGGSAGSDKLDAAGSRNTSEVCALCVVVCVDGSPLYNYSPPFHQDESTDDGENEEETEVSSSFSVIHCPACLRPLTVPCNGGKKRIRRAKSGGH